MTTHSLKSVSNIYLRAVEQLPKHLFGSRLSNFETVLPIHENIQLVMYSSSVIICMYVKDVKKESLSFADIFSNLFQCCAVREVKLCDYNSKTESFRDEKI